MGGKLQKREVRTPEIPAAEFKAVMGSFPSGVTVVTTYGAAGEPVGITVSAFSSLSLDPPLCLVCIDQRSGAREALLGHPSFAVNVLSDQQESVSNLFAFGKGDRFAQVSWEKGPATGCPVFPQALAWMECDTADVLPGGDHDIFLGRLQSVRISDGKPLLYWRGAYGDITSRPKSW